jgi:hypothetical protein
VFMSARRLVLGVLVGLCAVGLSAGFGVVSANATALPDGRVMEMVTPPNNHNADIYSPEMSVQGNSGYGTGAEVPFQASADGSAVTYAGDPGPEGNGAAIGGLLANQYIATRSPDGWVQHDIAPPGHNHAHYLTFSSDLSTGVLVAGGQFEEPEPLPETEAPSVAQVIYERHSDNGSEQALFGSLPANASPDEFRGGFTAIPFAGGSSDFSTLLFEAKGPLTAGATSGHDLYEWKNGQLSLVNVLPGGGYEPDASFGNPDLHSTFEGIAPEYSHDISADGSRIFWTGLNSDDLYMSEAGVEPVQLDASRAGGPGGGGMFWTASSDGSRVFFTDEASAMLTADTVPGSGVNLYEYDVNNRGLTDLTAGSDARVQGVIGASEDGSYVYFVADGILAQNAPVGGCTGERETLDSTCDLYVRHDGVTKFVAALSDRDGLNMSPYLSGAGEGENGDWVHGLGHRTAEVTPSGNALVFMSSGQLTNYKTDGFVEVYVYDDETGELSCASCDSSVAAPQATESFRELEVAAAVPISWDATHMTRWISSDGDEVFFDSFIPLVPQDTNGLIDVYEWERSGTGSCHTVGGCVSLLSGGKSDNNSYLFDSSENGEDVFLSSQGQLTSEPDGGVFAVYDARANGSAPPAGLACSGTGCQGVPAAPPIFATPSSVTFNGIGNFPAPSNNQAKPRAKLLKCKKGYVKKKGKCIRERVKVKKSVKRGRR